MLKLSKVPAFGYLTKEIAVADKHYDNKVLQNVRKVLSYIPGLSLAQGIENIVRAATEKDKHSPHLFIRGVMEILGVGIFLLIPDLIVTAIREKIAKQVSLQGRKIEPVVAPVVVAVSKPSEPVTFVEEIKAFVEPQPVVDVIEPEAPVIPVKIRKPFYSIEKGLEDCQKAIEEGKPRRIGIICERLAAHYKQHNLLTFWTKLAYHAEAADICLTKLISLGILNEADNLKLIRAAYVKIARQDNNVIPYLPVLLKIYADHPDRIDLKSILLEYACKVGFNLAPYIASDWPLELKHEIGLEAVKYNPELTKENFHVYSFKPSKLSSLGKKKGSLEERKEQALKEIEDYVPYHTDVSPLKNLTFYKFNTKKSAESEALKEIIAAAIIAHPTSVPELCGEIEPEELLMDALVLAAQSQKLTVMKYIINKAKPLLVSGKNLDFKQKILTAYSFVALGYLQDFHLKWKNPEEEAVLLNILKVAAKDNAEVVQSYLSATLTSIHEATQVYNKLFPDHAIADLFPQH